MPYPIILRVMGVVLGGYLAIHFLGTNYGLLTGIVLALLYLS